MTERDILTEKLYAKEEGRAEGHADGLQEGLNKGRLEGREEGREEENRRVALNFKKAGVDISVISNATGLTVEQIKEL